MFEMKPLEKPAQHWTVTIDGVRQPGIRHIELASQWGTLIWGQRPEGFEGWTFKEAGGAITIPWARLNGRILIGMIAEMRPNMGQRPSWCAIGGILDPGETHQQERPKTPPPGAAATPEFEAMAIMGLEPPLSLAAIKTRYKALVKKHHPDVNQGDAQSGELLKSINMAYTILKAAYEKYEVIRERG